MIEVVQSLLFLSIIALLTFHHFIFAFYCSYTGASFTHRSIALVIPFSAFCVRVNFKHANFIKNFEENYQVNSEEPALDK